MLTGIQILRGANNELATHLARVGAREGALKYSQKAFNASNEYDAASNEHYGDYILRNLALACIAKAPLTETEYQELGRTEPERPIGSVDYYECGNLSYANLMLVPILIGKGFSTILVNYI